MSKAPRWGCWPDGWRPPKCQGRELCRRRPRNRDGGLIHHITGGAEAKTFQPMNVNFGLFPPIDAKGGRKGRKDRYKAYTDRAKEAFEQWLTGSS